MLLLLWETSAILGASFSRLEAFLVAASYPEILVISQRLSVVAYLVPLRDRSLAQVRPHLSDR